MYTCRECEYPINQATEICPYCGADLTEGTLVASPEPVRKRNWIAIVLLWGVPLGALWGFLWFVLPEQRGDAAGQAEARAVTALREISGTLAACAEAEGSYPNTLEALGGRVRAPAQRAQTEGYRVEYIPGPASSDAGSSQLGSGRVRTYTLLMRPGNYGYRSFYSDESGVVRATRENRPARAQDPPIQ